MGVRSRLVRMRAFRACWLSIVLGVTAAAAARQEPATRFVSVGTHKLEVIQAGSGSGTIVFEGGLGNDLSTWDRVRPAVAAFAPVVVYSRSGIGHSEPGPGTHTARDSVEDLRALLQALHAPRPCILVGASYGGMLARLYTSVYPVDVAGLVLVEGVHEQQVKRFGELDPTYPGAFRKSFADQLAKPGAEADEVRETVRIQEAGVVEGMKPLPDIPIAVLTSMKSDPKAAFVNGTPLGHEAWRAMHDEWAQRSTNSLHVQTSRSGHHVQDDEPQLVVDAIRFVRVRLGWN